MPGFRIAINDRRVLQALAQVSGVPASSFTDWTVAVDKLDKVGLDGVAKEFESRGIPGSALSMIEKLLDIRQASDAQSALGHMAELLGEVGATEACGEWRIGASGHAFRRPRIEPSCGPLACARA